MVGSYDITVLASPCSWETNSRPVQDGNEFGLDRKERAQLDREMEAGRFNRKGTDVTAAHANAAAIQEYIRQRAFDSANSQRLPQGF
jgi:hypothetical protein